MGDDNWRRLPRTGQRIVYFVQEASLAAHLTPRAGSGRPRGATDRAPRPSRKKEPTDADHH